MPVFGPKSQVVFVVAGIGSVGCEEEHSDDLVLSGNSSQSESLRNESALFVHSVADLVFLVQKKQSPRLGVSGELFRMLFDLLRVLLEVLNQSEFLRVAQIFEDEVEVGDRGGLDQRKGLALGWLCSFLPDEDITLVSEKVVQAPKVHLSVSLVPQVLYKDRTQEHSLQNRELSDSRYFGEILEKVAL